MWDWKTILKTWKTQNIVFSVKTSCFSKYLRFQGFWRLLEVICAALLSTSRHFSHQIVVTPWMQPGPIIIPPVYTQPWQLEKSPNKKWHSRRKNPLSTNGGFSHGYVWLPEGNRSSQIRRKPDAMAPRYHVAGHACELFPHHFMFSFFTSQGHQDCCLHEKHIW